MIKKFLFFQIWIIITLFANAAWSADKISGSACYTYGDNESLVQAEQMTKTLAIRNAIESYSTFIESTTKITDFQLSADLINTISTGQVKGVKVLKRLESGRKLCYTVEGFVEPKELRAEIKEYLSDKDKISDVRLQENGWIRIVDHFVENLTPEEFYGVSADDPMVKIRKDMVTQRMIDKDIFRKLNIKFEFLQPCMANTKNEEYYKEFNREWKEAWNYISDHPNDKRQHPLSPKSRAYMNILMMDEAQKKGDKEAVERLMGVFEKNCKEAGIDPQDFLSDIELPRFRCDYRLRIFVTFLTKEGLEIKTMDEIPYALLLDGNSGKRKTEMLPGERMYVTFLIPDKAKSWKVWVPK